MGASNTGGKVENSNFQPISRYISETVQDMDIVTMEGYRGLVRALSNSALSSDHKWPLGIPKPPQFLHFMSPFIIIFVTGGDKKNFKFSRYVEYSESYPGC